MGTTAMKLAELASAIDTLWVLLAAMLVFIMQAGFAMVESGFARKKNTANILMKNVLDFSIGSLLFWTIGFGLMFGSGVFVGNIDLFGMSDWSNTLTIPNYAFLIFQTMFCATAATIVSGAVAERTKFTSYLIYASFIFTVIYPISGHWVWGGGWLSQLGFVDFAGSSVVHALGGWMALVGAWIVGPRIGKYRKGKVSAIPGHSLTIAALGIFILWFGWFGFNPGSSLGITGAGMPDLVSSVFMTTNLAAAAGAISALVLAWFKYGKPTLSLSLNGVLAGLVGVTAGCDVVSPVGAVVIGVVCGILMVYSVEFIDTVLKIDDPVGAVSVHGVCGTVGTILTGVLATKENGGWLASGSFDLLGAQLIGAFTIMAWGLSMGFLVFKSVDMLKGMRVDRRIEEEGLDIYEHGESAYN
ncbi:MAG: ammonium transporter [Rikenellaceae bacterium]